MDSSREAWLDFRRGEVVEPEPRTLLCVICEKPTTEADTHPDFSYGGLGCEAPVIEIGTMCLDCGVDA